MCVGVALSTRMQHIVLNDPLWYRLGRGLVRWRTPEKHWSDVATRCKAHNVDTRVETLNSTITREEKNCCVRIVIAFTITS